jgi:hypothetical protein
MRRAVVMEVILIEGTDNMERYEAELWKLGKDNFLIVA